MTIRKKAARTALILLCAALVLPPLTSCGLFKSRPSGIYVEEGAEYPYSCRIEGDTIVWLFCGEEESRTTFTVRTQKAYEFHGGLYRIVTDGMPFPDPCDDMLFWDKDNDRLLLSLFASDGTVVESYLTPGREG